MTHIAKWYLVVFKVPSVSCTGSSLFLGTSTLLGKQHSLDVWQDATLSNGNASEELVQLFVVPA